MKKLTCHCGGVEAEVNVPEKGFQKIMRCNCSICKRKGYIIGVLGPDDFSLVKGEDLLTLYQFKTKTAQHYFCKVCGIHTHNRPRSNPKIYGVNIACIEGIKPFEIENVPVNDGENHPLDQKNNFYMHPIDECYKKVKNDCFKFINLQETKTNKFKNKNKMLKSYLIPLSFWIKKKLKKKIPVDYWFIWWSRYRKDYNHFNNIFNTTKIF